MSLRSILFVVVVSLAGSTQALAQAKSPVEGVWKVAEVQVIGGANRGPMPARSRAFTSSHGVITA